MQKLQILASLLEYKEIVLFLFTTMLATQLIRRAGKNHEQLRSQEASITGLTEYDF